VVITLDWKKIIEQYLTLCFTKCDAKYIQLLPPLLLKNDFKKKKQTPLTAYICVSVIAQLLMKSVNKIRASYRNES